MEPRCCRCGAAAAAAMSYDYHERQLWLGDLDGPIEPGAAYPMCDAHADRMSPPMGWLLNDRRSTNRTLFIAREVA